MVTALESSWRLHEFPTIIQLEINRLVFIDGSVCTKYIKAFKTGLNHWDPFAICCTSTKCNDKGTVHSFQILEKVEKRCIGTSFADVLVKLFIKKFLQI